MVYTLGESLVDIILTTGETATMKAGGGMLNTAVSLARSGVETALISEVGDDRIASFILDFLQANAVKTGYVKRYYHQATSIALAWLDPQGKPEFTIHKSYPEQRRLVGPAHFERDDILVFGSLYSLEPGIRGDLLPILAMAKRAGAFLIYDPNIRRHSLDDNSLLEAFRENVAFADVVKGSDEDMQNLFGTKDPEQCMLNIRHINPSATFILTKGARGATGFMGDEWVDMPAYDVHIVSTIGAGDGFNAGLARYLVKLRKQTGSLQSNELKDMLASGQAFASAVCGSMDNYVARDFSFSL